MLKAQFVYENVEDILDAMRTLKSWIATENDIKRGSYRILSVQSRLT